MEGVKERMLYKDYEQMIQWMRDTFDIPDGAKISEDYSGFSSMVEMYQDVKQHQDYEDYLRWVELHPYEEVYSVFCVSLQELKAMIPKQVNPFLPNTMLHHMIYAHAVTLFEAMIGDFIKALVIKYPHAMDRLVKGISEDAKEKYTLKDISRLNGVGGIVMSIINDVTFHNVSKVERYVSILIGGGFGSRSFNDMSKVVSVRHDIVHRNGKNKEDQFHAVTGQVVADAIKVVEQFSEDVYQAVIEGVKV